MGGISLVWRYEKIGQMDNYLFYTDYLVSYLAYLLFVWFEFGISFYGFCFERCILDDLDGIYDFCRKKIFGGFLETMEVDVGDIAWLDCMVSGVVMGTMNIYEDDFGRIEI